MASVAELIDEVAAAFDDAELSYGHGTDNAWDEAVALVLGITGLADDISQLGVLVDETSLQRIREVTHQRVSVRVPLAHLLGRCTYAGFQFEITPDVIVPRSPIGHLLHDRLNPWLGESVRHVLDLCCGSGCLGIIAAHRFVDARVTMVEIDPSTAELARRNVQAHGLTDRVSVLCADVADFSAGDRYDLIVSNPPYVNAQDMLDLPAEYRAEPTLALAAGQDGLSGINTIFAHLSEWIEPGSGVFVGEVGESVGALNRAFPTANFVWLDSEPAAPGVFLLSAADLPLSGDYPKGAPVG